MSGTIGTPQPAPSNVKKLTSAEFIQQYRGEHVELVKGEIKEAPMPSPKHGKICARMVTLLQCHIDANDLGHVMCNDSFVQTRHNPDTVRGPAVSYYSYERLPKGELTEGLLLSAVPELTVEVRSPSNTWTEIFAKIHEYLRAGVLGVVVLDSATTSASVYRAEELQQIFHNGDELVLPDILPGFAVAVQKLFD